MQNTHTANNLNPRIGSTSLICVLHKTHFPFSAHCGICCIFKLFRNYNASIYLNLYHIKPLIVNQQKLW